MKNSVSVKFWQCFDVLPQDIQTIARSRFELLKHNPSHPSLQFKPVKNGASDSVRVSRDCRALGIPWDEGCNSFGLVAVLITTNCWLSKLWKF